MDAYKAAELICNNVTYKPGWRIMAQARDNYTVTIYIEARVNNSDRRYAPTYSPQIYSDWSFDIDLSKIYDDENQLYAEVLRGIIGHEIHEAREFFKTDGTSYSAAFHPHTSMGNYLWSKCVSNNRDFPTH